jgi:ATP-dependent RNA helicase SUPV3L1/SUV3
VLGPRVLRIDRVERLAALARRLIRQSPFGATPELAALAGCPADALSSVLAALGYRAVLSEDGGVTFHGRPRRSEKRSRGKPDRRRGRRGGAEKDIDSPFAKLRDLRLAR